ncbi:hypothetical protein [Kineosporia sp. NBRC 101731]|uniref:hypothetical protein n=1 Tax=Kineosporia sp. NBRC 101731 TaxID=3032199 RepID=UPI0024A32D83|nr:hypothetical protein [Kineosporia sp. NBRC 101731]GLY27040.1 hypothetical protein Kisp02_04050 [Kineosporia sp. NBRC 101731]
MTSADITVEVHAQRQGKWWVLRLDDGGTTQVKSLGDVDEMVTDYVSLMRGVPAENILVSLVSIDPGPGMAAKVKEAKQARDEADRAQEVAARAIRDTANALKNSGLAGLEVARVLGVSPQRVSQLTSKKTWRRH